MEVTGAATAVDDGGTHGVPGHAFVGGMQGERDLDAVEQLGAVAHSAQIIASTRARVVLSRSGVHRFGSELGHQPERPQQQPAVDAAGLDGGFVVGGGAGENERRVEVTERIGAQVRVRGEAGDRLGLGEKIRLSEGTPAVQASRWSNAMKLSSLGSTRNVTDMGGGLLNQVYGCLGGGGPGRPASEGVRTAG